MGPLRTSSVRMSEEGGTDIEKHVFTGVLFLGGPSGKEKEQA